MDDSRPLKPERSERRFPFVEIRGAPRERGRQYGEACREQVRGYVETLRRVLAGEAQLRSLDNRPGGGERRSRTGLSPSELSARALTFLPAFEAFAPHLVEEIRGVGEAAGVPFAAALLVNVRAEVAGVGPATGGATLPSGVAV